ncbi:zinc finger protein 704 isoform X2 [Contarinia nasturtii]|nr:zinc finger protein 704 isoform X2 [Contarinia nasturtii]
MANDRRRASNSIDVPLTLSQYGSRKRRPSFSHDGDLFLNGLRDDEQMNECNAALVLMSLSGSPHSPRPWMLGSSPASNSSGSWTSCSDDLNEENINTLPQNYVNANAMETYQNVKNNARPIQNSLNNHSKIQTNRLRTASLSTSDEGIVMDYNDETPRKRKINTTLFKCTWKKCSIIHKTVDEIENHVREVHLGVQKSRNINVNDDDDDFDDNLSDDAVPDEAFYYTEIEAEIEAEDFNVKSPNPPSPPTLSHRDMARPPHEDPEYQRRLVGNMRQGLLTMSQSVKPPLPNAAGAINIPNSPLAHHNYTWAQQNSLSPQKHVRLSPRPSTSYAPYPSPTYTSAIAAAQHNVNIALGLQNNYGTTNGSSIRGSGSITIINNSNSSIHHSQSLHTSNHLQQPQHSDILNLSHSAPSTSASIAANIHRSQLSPNRRPRGENKKCRKQYGMEKKELWCTQCKWKKACSRFGD